MLNLLAQSITTNPEIQWSLIWPIVILSLGGILLITVTSIVPSWRTNSVPAAITIALSLVTLATLPGIWTKLSEAGGQVPVIADAIRIDAFTLVVVGIMCLALALTALVLDDYLQAEGLDGPEWYVLLIMSATGGILMAAANDLIVVFVGLEILSIAVYVLAALHLRRTESQEAGFKYFILGALSSAIFLYGIALVYGATGQIRLTEIARVITGPENAQGINPINEASLLLAGMAMLIIGFAFKISAAPFHVWTPDVYQGSPTSITGFMSSAVKAAGVAGMVRVFVVGFGQIPEDWVQIVAVLAVMSVAIGALSAISQSNVKRMLAYSSVVHAGFMMVGLYSYNRLSFATGTDSGVRSVVFYLFAYAIMSLGTFAAVTAVGGKGDERHDISDYEGLAKSSPMLAAMLSILLFAQAGMPFTIGFWAKARVILAAAENNYQPLAAFAMLLAVVAAFVYLRLVVKMFMSEAETEPSEIEFGRGTFVVVAICAALTLLFGFFPGFMGDWFDEATRALVSLR